MIIAYRLRQHLLRRYLLRDEVLDAASWRSWRHVIHVWCNFVFVVQVKAKFESGSFIQRRDKSDFTVELLNNCLANAQSKPNACNIVIGNIIKRTKQRKQLILIGKWYSSTCVWYFTNDLLGFPIVINVCHHASFESELQSIRNQVDQHLEESLLVAYSEVRHVVVELYLAVNFFEFNFKS